MGRELIIKREGDCQGAISMIGRLDRYKISVLEAAKDSEDPPLLLFYCSMWLDEYLMRLKIIPEKTGDLVAEYFLQIPKMLTVAQWRDCMRRVEEDMEKNGLDGAVYLLSRSLRDNAFSHEADPCKYHSSGDCLKLTLIERDAVLAIMSLKSVNIVAYCNPGRDLITELASLQKDADVALKNSHNTLVLRCFLWRELAKTFEKFGNYDEYQASYIASLFYGIDKSEVSLAENVRLDEEQFVKIHKVAYAITSPYRLRMQKISDMKCGHERPCLVLEPWAHNLL